MKRKNNYPAHRRPPVQKQLQYLPENENRLLTSELDRQNYRLLIKLISLYHKLYWKILLGIGSEKTRQKNREFDGLLLWIKKKTPVLQQAGFDVSIPTMCRWIFDGLTDFPECKLDGCTNKVMQHVNVKSLYLGYREYCSIDCINKDAEVRAKIQNTTFNRTGYRNASQDPRVKEKKRLKAQEAYGVDNVFQAKAVKDAIRATNRKNRGVDYPMQSNKILAKVRQKYSYDNISFDSKPEIAFYVWLKDNGEDFEYQPDICLEYKCNRKIHQYHPDFRVGNTYYEIKGGHMIAEDGRWICPWDRSRDAQYDAKRRCVEANGVVVLTPKDYAKYLKYVDEKYGRGWLDQFKNVPSEK